jgi:ABC-type metal ion transport system, permease component
MLNERTIFMILEGTRDTLYMTLVSAICAYFIGIIAALILYLTNKGGLAECKPIYAILDIIVNLFRSVPFIILMLLVRPLTILIAGKSYGPTATIVSLVVAAAPYVARMVESSLMEIDKGVIEAAISMGASIPKIIFKVLLPESAPSLIVGVTISVGTIFSYSAMAGAIGGGGLGDIAIRYGYQRYQTDIMIVTVIVMVVLIQLIQVIGMSLAKHVDRR